MGIVHYEIKRGSFKKDDAREWVKTCIKKAIEKHGGAIVLAVDNAPCHSNLEEVLLDEQFKECKILRFGPYSPMFNPIENIWSFMKSKVKRELAMSIEQILNVQNSNLSIKERRLRALENLMREAIQSVSPALCVSCIASIQSKVSKALNLENMEF